MRGFYCQLFIVTLALLPWPTLASSKCMPSVDSPISDYAANPDSFLISQRFLGCLDPNELRNLGINSPTLLTKDQVIEYYMPQFSFNDDDKKAQNYIRTRTYINAKNTSFFERMGGANFKLENLLDTLNGASINKTDCGCMPQNDLDRLYFSAIDEKLKHVKRRFRRHSRRLVSKQYEQLAHDFLSISSLVSQKLIKPETAQNLFAQCTISKMTERIKEKQDMSDELKSCMDELGDEPLKTLIGDRILGRFQSVVENKPMGSCMPYRAYLDITMSSSIDEAIPFVSNHKANRQRRAILTNISNGVVGNNNNLQNAQRYSRQVNQSIFTRYLSSDDYIHYQIEPAMAHIQPVAATLNKLRDKIPDHLIQKMIRLPKDSHALSPGMSEMIDKVLALPEFQEAIKAGVIDIGDRSLRYIVADKVNEIIANPDSCSSTFCGANMLSSLTNLVRGNPPQDDSITKYVAELKSSFLNKIVRSEDLMDKIVAGTIEKCEALADPEVFTQLACPFAANRPEVFVTSGREDSSLLKIARAPAGCLEKEENEHKSYENKKLDSDIVNKLRHFDTRAGFAPNICSNDLFAIPKEFNEAFCRDIDNVSCVKGEDCQEKTQDLISKSFNSAVSNSKELISNLKNQFNDCSNENVRGCSYIKRMENILAKEPINLEDLNEEARSLYVSLAEDNSFLNPPSADLIDISSNLLMVTGSLRRLEEHKTIKENERTEIYRNRDEEDDEVKVSQIMVSGNVQEVDKIIKSISKSGDISRSIKEYEAHVSNVVVPVVGDNVVEPQVVTPNNISSKNYDVQQSSDKLKNNAFTPQKDIFKHNEKDSQYSSHGVSQQITTSSYEDKKSNTMNQKNNTRSTGAGSVENGGFNVDLADSFDPEIAQRIKEVHDLKSTLDQLQNDFTKKPVNHGNNINKINKKKNEVASNSQSTYSNTSNSNNAIRPSSGQYRKSLNRPNKSQNINSNNTATSSGVENTSYNPSSTSASVRSTVASGAGVSMGSGDSKASAGGGSALKGGRKEGRSIASVEDSEVTNEDNIVFASGELPMLFNESAFQANFTNILGYPGVLGHRIKTLEVKVNTSGEKRYLLNTYDFKPSDSLKKYLLISDVNAQRSEIAKNFNKLYELRSDKEKKIQYLYDIGDEDSLSQIPLYRKKISNINNVLTRSISSVELVSSEEIKNSKNISSYLKNMKSNSDIMSLFR